MAQEIFYQKYFADAYRTCNRYLSQYADVMAVVNEGFLKVFQNLHRFDSEQGTPGAWMHRIMVHVSIDHIRKGNRLGILDPFPEGDARVLSVDNEILSDIDAEELLLMVKHLPETTRVVFNLSVMEGYSHQEIARQLNLSASTSRWHLSEAKKRLQQQYRDKEKVISA